MTIAATRTPVFRAAPPDDTAAIERLLTGASLPTVGVADLLRADARQFIVAFDPDNSEGIVAVADLEHYFPRFGFGHVARDAVPMEIANTLEFRSACPASATAMTRTLTST